MALSRRPSQKSKVARYTALKKRTTQLSDAAQQVDASIDTASMAQSAALGFKWRFFKAFDDCQFSTGHFESIVEDC